MPDLMGRRQLFRTGYDQRSDSDQRKFAWPGKHKSCPTFGA